MILKKEVIESVSNKLNLNFTGFEQDWEIEFADSGRLNEFISYYKENKDTLSKDEKIAVMSLIWASYDDYLNDKERVRTDFWNQIKILVNSELIIFSDLIKYWSVENETDSEIFFKITPLVRNLKASQ